LTFSFNPATGFSGLVTGRPATVIQSSSGTYLPGSGAEGYDFLTGYLETWLGFIGFTDIRSLAIAPTGTDPDTLSGIEERAVNDAKESAHAF
jgi:FMN-dependent NADH-azoreductase